MSQRRTDFLAWLAAQDGKPYIYGCKTGSPGFDCSGLVTAGFRAVGLPDWRNSHNAARLHAELRPTNKPQAGDLVFYGRDPAHVDHVMVYLADNRVHGASGAGADCTTVAYALAHGACVHTRPSIHYRDDCLGFAVSPLD